MNYDRFIAPALLVACSLAGGCMAAPEDEYRNAVPSQQELSIDVPGSTDSSEGAATAPLLGERADFYQLTRNTSRGVNGLLWVTLHVLHEIVSHPATEVHEDHAVWGPWNETLSPVTYELVVERVEEGRYRYVLRGKPRAEGDAAYVDLIGGETEIDHASGVKRGTIGYDLDAAHALDAGEHPGQGRMAASWDAGSNPRVVEAAFEDIVGAAGETPFSALYRYTENSDGSGSFELAVRGNVDGTATAAAEDVVLMTRWDITGAGRGDAVVSAGDVGDMVVYANECWDGSFARTFWLDTHALQPNEGDPATCPYAEPLWSEMSME